MNTQTYQTKSPEIRLPENCIVGDGFNRTVDPRAAIKFLVELSRNKVNNNLPN